MLSTTSLLRRVVALWLIAIFGAWFVHGATAQTIDVSLNVLFNNPLDPDQSGGKWQIVAMSSPDTFGIAALDLRLTGIVPPAPLPVGPRGTVNNGDPAGFSELATFTLGQVVNVIIGQTPIGPARLEPDEEESVFYGVGTIANGQPGDVGPALDTLANAAAIPWATSNLFGNPDWSTAALLATGSFLPGAQLGFQPNTSSGQVYTAVGTSTTQGTRAVVQLANFHTTVRSNEGATPDYNLDGLVNAADYTLWRDSLGRTGPGLAADGNRDGVVDIVDYSFWKANFGLIVPGSGGGSAASRVAGTVASRVVLDPGAVPEPASAALWLGAAILLFLRRKNALSRRVRFP